MSKDLAIAGTATLTNAINSNKFIEEPEAWENLVMRITELHNRVLMTLDEELIVRWAEHAFVLALATDSFIGDFPDTALYNHIDDTVQWIGNLC